MNLTDVLIDVLLFFFVIDSMLMGLVIMMQRSKQEGLGAAFGGGFTESVWGAQTSQVLVKATVWFAAIFFILSISLARLYSNRAHVMEKGSPLQQELLKPVAPASTSATPAAISTATVPASAPATNVPVATPATPVSSASKTPAPSTPAKPAAK